VLGNPPWERIKLQEQEFFAARSPEIANAPNKAARDRLIKALATAPEGSAERALSDAFIYAKREAEATSEFVRVDGDEGGRFVLTGRGDVNTYALFAELFARLAGPTGRAGVIVPTGIATDATTAPFFAWMIETKRLASLISFENEEFIFPAVHHSFRFSLLSISSVEQRETRFAFYLRHPSALAEPERNFTLSPEQIEAINPNTRTAPVFRTRHDAELTAKIYVRAPVLIDERRGPAGNPWGVSYLAMFHMSNDSGLFRTAAQLAAAGFVRYCTEWVAERIHSRSGVPGEEGSGAGNNESRNFAARAPGRYVPLYEAKMVHQFDHRWASFNEEGTDASDCEPESKAKPNFESRPRYWVPVEEVINRRELKRWSRPWQLGWRRNARSHDQRTMIVSLLVDAFGVGDSIFCLNSEAESARQVCLFANLNSIILDFSARQKISGINMSYFLINQFPVIVPSFYTEPRIDFIVPKVLELTYTSDSLAPFARDLGHDGPPFAWDEDRRAHLRADLDAFYTRAYGLTRDELRYILDPADVKGPEYPSETFRVLKEKEIRQFREYRTRRLVLAAWDRMEANGEFKVMGM